MDIASEVRHIYVDMMSLCLIDVDKTLFERCLSTGKCLTIIILRGSFNK